MTDTRITINCPECGAQLTAYKSNGDWVAPSVCPNCDAEIPEELFNYYDEEDRGD